MGQIPSDSEILRFSEQFDTDMMHELVIHLHLSKIEWEDMRVNHPHNIELVKFLILIRWRERKTGTFRDLNKALIAMRINTHQLCQVGLLLLSNA